MSEKIITYLLLAFFFGLDFIIRKDKTAKKVDSNPDDKKSTYFLILTFFFVLVVSTILNLFNIGIYENVLMARLGIGVMALGFLIRISSMITLKNYYSRSLRTVKEQVLIRKGLYSIIRHPGYLGTMMIWGAAGLGMSNILVLIGGFLLISIAYRYRIINEERMLEKAFGESYHAYQIKSWRLFPLIW